jgi:hypothetical protein
MVHHAACTQSSNQSSNCWLRPAVRCGAPPGSSQAQAAPCVISRVQLITMPGQRLPVQATQPIPATTTWAMCPGQYLWVPHVDAVTNSAMPCSHTQPVYNTLSQHAPAVIHLNGTKCYTSVTRHSPASRLPACSAGAAARQQCPSDHLPTRHDYPPPPLHPPLPPQHNMHHTPPHMLDLQSSCPLETSVTPLPRHMLLSYSYLSLATSIILTARPAPKSHSPFPLTGWQKPCT